MKILGIHDGHDASACLMINGKVISANQEERFSKLKGDYGLPLNAIKSCLKQANIKNEYEGETYTLVEGFQFETSSYERQSNGKGQFVDRGNKKILPIKYTPDFVGDGFIIETKGRANESFPIRWKLFKNFVNRCYPHVTLYKPQNQKECDQVIQLITKNK